jgi:hypothetical protein
MRIHAKYVYKALKDNPHWYDQEKKEAKITAQREQKEGKLPTDHFRHQSS